MSTDGLLIATGLVGITGIVVLCLFAIYVLWKS